MSVYKLLLKIVVGVVDWAEFVVIETQVTEDGATFTVRAHPDDTGRVIGKQGRNVRFIRTRRSSKPCPTLFIRHPLPDSLTKDPNRGSDMAYGAKRSWKAPRVSRQDFYIAGMILYVIVLDAKNAGDYTVFQGFSVNALDEFAAIREICRLPAHVDDLFSERNEVARRRMYGQTGYSILLLESEFFEQLEGHPGFVCVISNAATHAAVSAHFAQRKNNRWLHVTTVEEPTGEPKLWNLDRKQVYD